MREKMFWQNSRGRKFLARMAENWPAKVLSVALAIILFMFHRMSTLETRFFSVPLNVEIDSVLIPASPYTRMVRVSLRGDANSVFPILEDDIEAYIDLRKYKNEGWYRAPVQVRKKGTALGVEPLEISVDPMEISLHLDHKISKYIPLTANLRGSPESGYDIISYTLTPAQVVVDGPMNVVEAISEIYTDYIDLDGRNGDFSVSIGILNQDPLLIIRGSGTTEFRGFIRKPVQVRSFEEVPIMVSGLDGRFRAELDVRTGSARIEGDQESLDAFTPPLSFLAVDCSGLSREGSYALPLTVDLPEGLNLVRKEPEGVTVSIRLAADGDLQ
jgi:YbbR domain-containing protein